jgi:SAM-dependent methyltransferase
MRERRFGPRELYAGSRFLAPLSEAALLEAGRAAGLHEGATLLDVASGNGCAAIFLAEAFHLYVRGIEGDPELLDVAQANGAKSPARRRLRFSPPEAQGPVDFVASLRVPASSDGRYAPRPGGRLLLGGYVAPPGLGFPVFDPPGGAAWRREATPLEWERFLAPLELAIRAHRAGLRPGEEAAPLAEEAGRQIRAFRAHASVVRYELVVVEAGSA